MASKSLGSITLDLIARIGGFTQGMTAAERASAKAARAIEARQKQSAQAVQQAWTTAMRYIGGVLAVREVIQAADTYTLLSSRLKLVSKDAQSFAEAQSEIVRIANDSRVGLEETAALYTQIARSSQGLGFSQKELLGVTESINQALLVSGGSAESAKAALTQLSQAFASGVLRGEEFNSVAEQAPRVLQAIADGVGVGIGELREMAKQGELTATRVVKALQSQAAVLEAEAKGIPLTIGQATTQATNSLMLFIGAVDQSAGATAGLASAISESAKALGELAIEVRRAGEGAQDVGFLATAFTVVSQAARIFASDVSFVLKGIGREVVGIAAQVGALARFDLSGFTAISDAMKADAARARAELDKYQFQVLNPFLNSRGRGTTGGADPRLIGTTPAEETVGYRRPRGGADVVDTSTIAGLERQIKAIKELRENAKVGSDEFARLTKELNGLEAQLKKLNPRDSRKAGEDAVKQAQSYLENLRKQLQATEDLTVAETVRRDIEAGRVKLAGGVTKQQLLDLAMQIDMDKELARIAEQFKKLEEESLERKKALKEAGKAIYDATRTPAEQLNIELTKLNDLLAKGAIDWDTYGRAVFEAQDRFEAAATGAKDALSEWDQFKKTAIENTQGALADSLFAGMRGEFDNILGGFTQMLQRMVAEALAADLARKMFGSQVQGGQGDGWFGQALKWAGTFFGGGKAAGGAVNAGGMYRVNENGPEMLEMNGRSYLMMGGQSGTVSNAGGTNVVNNFTVSGNVDRRTEAQIGRAATRGVQRAQRWM